jgi:hypothetical protein
MAEHLTASQHWEFLDCKGNLLCEAQAGEIPQKFKDSGLNIDFNNCKIIIETKTSFNVNFNQ